MKLLIFLLTALALLKITNGNTSDFEYKTCSLIYNELNVTFGDVYFTLMKHVPEVGHFEWKLNGSPKMTVKDESEIKIPIMKILQFTSNVDEKNITFQLSRFNETNGTFSYSANIETRNSRILLEKTDDHLFLQVFVARMWNDFNAMKLIVNFLQATRYKMKYFGPKEYGRFYSTDFLAEGYGVPVVVHNAEILEYKKTPFQRITIVDTKQVGKCLFLDQITQYCERLGNYTNVFLDHVDRNKPKDILMIGGGDLVILKKIVQSKRWKDINSFTLVEIDNDVVEISKKYFHTDHASWLNDPKIIIKIQDANKYVLDLPKEVKFDAILMDTTDPEMMISLKLFQQDFFHKLKDYHMHLHSFILMQFGLIEEKTENINSPNIVHEISHPKAASLFKTRIQIKYTPEYIGHTVFYKMKINPNHTHFVPISQSETDFTMKRNPHNITFGSQLTLLRNDKFPKSNFFNITMYNVSFDKISDEKQFEKKIDDIIEFTNAKITKTSYSLKNGKFRAIFDFDMSTLEFISLNSTTIVFFLNVLKSDLNFYNTIELIVDYFKPQNYSVIYEFPRMNTHAFKYTNYTKGDLVAYESGEYTIIHGAKILEWVQTEYQRALYFESATLGRGLIIDSSLQMFQNSNNYVDYYYTKIKKMNAKNILIIGGSDIRVLKRISDSDLMESIHKITVVDSDEIVYELSKKYLHPDYDDWFDIDKTNVLFEDPNQYVLDLPKDGEKFDLVIMDTTSPESFQEYNMFQLEFFEKLRDYHMHENSTILLHSGYVTTDGYMMNYSKKKPNFLKIFDYKTESVFTPEYTGHMIFYILNKKK